MPNIIPVASNNSADINSAIASASDGDIVQLLAATGSLTSQIAFSKGITIRGAGASSILIDNIPKTGVVEDAAFNVTVSPEKRYRFTEFKFQGNEPDTGQYNVGHFIFAGTSNTPNIRLDHLTVATPKFSFVRTYGRTFGLIDHLVYNIEVTFPRAAIIFCGMEGWGGHAHGDGSWYDALQPGSFNAWYVQNNALSYPVSGTACEYIVDALQGGRLVIRDNHFLNCTISSHGTETGNRERSYRWMEIYRNLFEYTGTQIDTNIFFRGGSGIIANNTVIGGNPGLAWNTFVKFDNYRSVGSYPPWGICDGSGPYDGNDGSPTGYLCIDQVGAGTSRLLSGDPPSGGDALQISEPVYCWGNSLNATPTYGGVDGIAPQVAHIEEDRDFFVGTERPGYSFAGEHPLIAEESSTIVVMGSCLS